MSLITLHELREAQKRLRGVVRRTPLIPMEAGPEPGRLWVKAEGLQPIGSFKLRGAYNKIAQLPLQERARGVITFSSGNHGQGVAYAARAMGIKAVVVMPSNAPEIKREATAALGADIVIVGPNSYERKAKAEELAAAFGYVIIPPYDDRAIIAGQGTCGLEIIEDMPDVSLVLVPVGGGGLLSGIAAAIKLSRPEVTVLGVEPEFAADAAESMKAGKLMALNTVQTASGQTTGDRTAETLADGLRTQSVGILNFAHLQVYVDGIVTVTEPEIREAMRRIIFATRLVPEPSGAVAVAAALSHGAQLPPNPRAVAVMSGGNVEPAVLSAVLQEGL
jgi:threonine dehydratase